MRKNGRQVIPDFSRKPPSKGQSQGVAAPTKTAPPPVPMIKPRATSAKSGHRGK